jgi:hypothetical protein
MTFTGWGVVVWIAVGAVVFFVVLRLTRPDRDHDCWFCGARTGQKHHPNCPTEPPR